MFQLFVYSMKWKMFQLFLYSMGKEKCFEFELQCLALLVLVDRLNLKVDLEFVQMKVFLMSDPQICVVDDVKEAYRSSSVTKVSS